MPYAKDYFVQTIVMFLIVLVRLDFLFFSNLKHTYKNRVTNFRFSLFTKITTSTYLFFLYSVLSILLLEHNHAFKGLSWHQALFDSLFQSATHVVLAKQLMSHFSDATNIISILMFIGSLQVRLVEVSVQPFAILILFIINFNNTADKTGIKAFNREIHIMDIQRSFAVFTMASILTFVSMIIIAATEQGKLTFIQIFLR